ncbi:MAG: hypothetical protein IT369_22020 [Candidatus Latescibacteria bacterium]|nr:hypothetical protein [Candidatus Latescibacterota bacterium]
MNVHSLWRHRRDLTEIGWMYLIVVGLFLAGLVVWELGQLQTSPWEGKPAASEPPSLHYGR